ncbi:hypothetical protein BGZ96_009242 [Linnemannia gamsii]|uniref:F-box domain-containing protein n=1 Tax=Linnemannia gamsii TaxID=64522 RepID=A0ABQ7JX70_9FUNG|nr:hypothetical protein BGZ96_009242 [Linnemannia gamsii]
MATPTTAPIPSTSEQASTISQLSLFTRLPSELILHIFSYLDIVTIFRFLDTCRYHRYLLLNLPEIWQRIRFIPLTEYSTTANTAVSLSAAAAASSGGSSLTGFGAGAGTGTEAVAGPSRYKRPIRTKKPSWQRDDSETSSSESEPGSDGSDDTKTTTNASTAAAGSVEGSTSTATATGAAGAHRLKHAESERDRERGGSRTLISEIYAVLRRFRKENRLVDFVREIYMDSTDSHHFPAPLVMLFKFPNLHTLSSRYRRNQTSLTNDTKILKDGLRNGDILPHSLKLRRWDIFHPYMTEEDVTGFKAILGALSAVGRTERREDPNSAVGADGSRSGVESETQGVLLDIKMCPGPITYVPSPSQNTNQSLYTGNGIHWAVPNTQSQASTPQPAPTTVPVTAGATTPPPPETTAQSQPAACTNIVWTLEKCRVCDASQDRCYRCVGQCRACGAVRAPPYINHQTLLERERARHTSARSASSTTAVTSASNIGSGQGFGQTANATGRPRTPPGSISLSQMSNPGSQPIMSAYYPLSSPSPSSAGSAAASVLAPSLLFSGLTGPPPVVAPVALALPPEFSLFD